uniref:Uncharacterized protein n=1 Tax=Avena sativa TaxID=4498 RepID=A0ACD5UWR4_AVESA
MPILEKLSDLVVLELWGYEGQTMSCSPEGFPRLLVLKLGGFFVKKWSIEPGAMKALSNLTLEDGVMPRDLQNGAALEDAVNVAMLKPLTKLPECLLHLQSLKELKLVKMPQISRYDSTYLELQKKACKVRNH